MNADALLNLLSVSIHFFIAVFIPHTLLAATWNDIQYIIPSFSLPHTVSVLSCPPFSKIFCPLSDRPVVCTSINSMRLCEASKLNALKLQHFNQMVRRPYLGGKYMAKSLWMEMRGPFAECFQMSESAHTNEWISRGVPADPVLSSAECKLTDWSCTVKLVWLHLVQVPKGLALLFFQKSYISRVLELHPFDVKRKYFRCHEKKIHQGDI